MRVTSAWGYGGLDTSSSGVGTIDQYDYNGTVSHHWEFDRALAFGGELGVRDLGETGLRLGLAFTQFTADVDSITMTFSGTITDINTGQTLTGSGSDTLSSGGLDQEVKLFGLNAYYDFDSGNAFTPFIGAGIGFADMDDADDKEFAFSVHAGGQYAFGDSGAYLGLKGSYYRINGPTAGNNALEFDDVDAFTVLATLGYKF